MKSIAAIALALGMVVTPAVAGDPQGRAQALDSLERSEPGTAAENGLSRDGVMGREVVSSDGTAIGEVVDVLADPDGSVLAVAIVNPADPHVGLAVSAEMLSMDGDRLVAEISDAEIAELPEPEMPAGEAAPGESRIQ